MPKSFSEHAKDKLQDLYANHTNEVGVVLKQKDPVLYANYKATSCITYAINVISYALEKTGSSTAASRVRKLGEHGTELAEYLVSNHNWRGVYISPDVVHSVDGSGEHAHAYRKLGRSCDYYSIPIQYKVINYNPTPATDPNFKKVNPSKPETSLNDVDLKVLNAVDFGFGVSRGGMHTWLFSLGYVYEVHWDEIGSSLYERTVFSAFGWLSGAIVVPPDRAKLLTMSAQTCAARGRRP